MHYWELSAREVVAIVEWELRENLTFVVANSLGERVVLQQHRGLPIGGHLSAALVELVALWQEYTCEWPIALRDRASINGHLDLCSLLISFFPTLKINGRL